MQLFIEENTSTYFLLFNSSLQQIFWHCPILPLLHLVGRNRWWIDIDTIDRYNQSCWILICSIDLSIKNKIVIYDRSPPKFFPIESNHRLKICFFLKTIYLIDFFTFNRLSISIQSMCFTPSLHLWWYRFDPHTPSDVTPTYANKMKIFISMSLCNEHISSKLHNRMVLPNMYHKYQMSTVPVR
jgi:hypothetical protein